MVFVFFSLGFFAFCVERVVPPTTVTALAKTCAFGVNQKFGREPLTESDNKLESEAADDGLIIKLAPQRIGPRRAYAPGAETISRQVGVKPATVCPLKVEVAAVEVAGKYSATTGPTTDNLG